MKVIVSTELKDNYNNYVVVKDFKSVKNIKGVTVLIIHKCDDISEFDAGVFISNFYSSGIKSFVYINSNPSKVIKTVINGVGGVIYEDEFYFEDEEELNALLDDLGMDTSTNSLVLSSTQIVKDFIGAFSRHEERIKSPVYLEQVSQAVNELSELTHKQELQISEMGVCAIEVFEKASSIIVSMNDQKKILEKQLEELEESQDSRQQIKQNSSFSSAIMFFPTFKYTGTTKILNVRELSPCRYLTSFLLAYIHHIRYELNKRVKFIIVHQKGKGVADKYSSFTSITQESMGFSALYENEIIATNNPKKDVMQKLTHQNDDVIIVLDRLYSSTDIISGKIVKVNALSGFSDLDRFKVKPETCIFPITSQPNELFSLPLMKNYPKETDMQYAVYSQTCKEHFNKLDSMLEIGKH